MRVVVAPPELHIDPVLGVYSAVVVVLLLVEQRGFADLPLVGGEEKDVRAGTIHFVTFAWVNRFFLHSIDFKAVKFHVQNLTQIHHY
jgi:hypothetical protein